MTWPSCTTPAPWSGRPPSGRTLTVVVADNGGGGIFSFLPQATHLAGRPLRAALRHPAGGRPGGGGPGLRMGRRGGGRRGLGASAWPGRWPRSRGGRVVVVRLPDRGANVAAHDEVNAAVVAAVEGRSLSVAAAACRLAAEGRLDYVVRCYVGRSNVAP